MTYRIDWYGRYLNTKPSNTCYTHRLYSETCELTTLVDLNGMTWYPINDRFRAQLTRKIKSVAQYSRLLSNNPVIAWCSRCLLRVLMPDPPTANPVLPTANSSKGCCAIGINNVARNVGGVAMIMLAIPFAFELGLADLHFPLLWLGNNRTCPRHAPFPATSEIRQFRLCNCAAH